MRYLQRCLTVSLALLLCGCFVTAWTYGTHGGGVETAVGEEQTENYPVADTYSMVQGVLRAEGVLFELQPDDSLITRWRDADTPPGTVASLVGVQPRYRYEVRVMPEGANKSKIIANVRIEDVPVDQVDRYKISRRLDLFHKLDQLASSLPPAPSTPSTGGVNFALLPNEDLQGLAKRVTGSADNWHEIAHDNGVTSPSDVSAFQTVWVRNDLLKVVKPKSAGDSDSGRGSRPD